MNPRKILHIDLDAFFCAVEEQHNPTLRGKAFAVGGRPDERGVVAACSYAARQFGLHSAMPMARAVRLCPRLIIVPSQHHRYRTVSREVMTHLHNLTPFVEQLSIDEAFLDVSDLAEPVAVIARQLQATINQALDLPCSLGVATNKLVAKIANNIGKASAKSDKPPNNIKIIPPGQEAAFLAPLSVRELWGVGPKTAERLVRLGLHTIGDVARYPENQLAQQFGKVGQDLAWRAKGLDDRSVETDHEAKSISQETTFTKDVTEVMVLHRTLRQQAEGVGRSLRQHDLSGITVKIKIRWADFTTLTRQITLSRPTNLDKEIYQAALALFEKTWPPGKRVRLLGVGVSSFETDAYQLGLWDQAPVEEDQRLQSALDELRHRFGDKAVRRGNQIQDEDE